MLNPFSKKCLVGLKKIEKLELKHLKNPYQPDQARTLLVFKLL
jgi:hypothetical protein